MKNLSLGLKIGTALLMSGILGTYVMAEAQQFENPIIAKPAPKQFDDPLFKKEDLKKPVVAPKKFENPIIAKPDPKKKWVVVFESNDSIIALKKTIIIGYRIIHYI